MHTKYEDRGPEFESLSESEWKKLCDDTHKDILWENRNPMFKDVTKEQWDALKE